jgi:deoxyadenosine/deoxycytidine kinase|tara:strand:+ start:998 stop:1210 length:213 start_codon:yes stop_codon:yes gene_type:complete
MPKSKTRGGATAHRKRVQARNTKIEGMKKKMQEQYMEEMTKRMEEYKKSLSAETENNEVVSNEQPLNIKL